MPTKEVTGSESEPADELAADLEYPHTDWPGFFRNHFGPSMLWALIGIGTSHLVLAPTLGGTYGLFAIWMFGLIYLAKYGAWELGIRYNYGVGKNPVEAYGDLPGPKNWMQWYTVLTFSVAYTGITAAVGMSTAAFVGAVTPLGFTQSFVVLVTLAGGLILFTEYSLLEKILIGFVAMLGGIVLIGAVVGPTADEAVVATAFSTPALTDALFLGLFASAAGFTPIGFSSSVLIGSWSMAKGEGARELRERNLDPTDEAYHDYIGAWIRTGRRDFNIGYAFSFVVVIAMVVLATVVLYPNPPTDDTLAFSIGSILGDTFGPWSYYVMVLGAIAALYSTLITTLDGATRVTGDVLPLLVDVDGERVRKLMIVGVVLGSSSIVVALGTVPVTFLIWIAAVIAITDILFYPANWYIVSKHLPEPFQPSRRWIGYYAVSLLVVVCFGLMGAAAEFGVFGS